MPRRKNHQAEIRKAALKAAEAAAVEAAAYAAGTQEKKGPNPWKTLAWIIWLYVLFTAFIGNSVLYSGAKTDCEKWTAAFEPLLLSNPWYVGIIAAMATIFIASTIHSVFAERRIKWLKGRLEVAKRSNVAPPSRLYYCCVDPVNGNCYLELKDATTAKIWKRFNWVTDDQLAKWFDGKGMKSMQNAYDQIELREIAKMFKWLRETANFQKSANRSLNASKIKQRDGDDQKEDLYTGDDKIHYNRASEIHLDV